VAPDLFRSSSLRPGLIVIGYRSMTAVEMALWAQVIASCGGGADPRLIYATLQIESGGRADAVNHNKNGTTDIGAMQINSANFARFGLTPETAKDPCRSVDAGVRHMIADGGPDSVTPKAIDALLATQAARAITKYNPGEATRLTRMTDLMAAMPRIQEVKPQPPCAAPKFDVWAQQACREAGNSVAPVAVRQPAAIPCDAPSFDVWGQQACRDAAAATGPTKELPE